MCWKVQHGRRPGAFVHVRPHGERLSCFEPNTRRSQLPWDESINHSILRRCPSLSNYVVLHRRTTLGFLDRFASPSITRHIPQRNASSFRDRLVMVYGAMRRRHDLEHGGLGEWFLLFLGLADFLMSGHRTRAAWRRLMCEMFRVDAIVGRVVVRVIGFGRRVIGVAALATADGFRVPAR
jgi:hypothetical protein